jgi:hypothetical protein
MRCLVDLLLLVDAELAGAAVDEQQETANDGQDLEEVVLGEVLVRVVLVELNLTWSAYRSFFTLTKQRYSQSRSCSRGC